ncbi:MAG: ABC transporter ATP-binding protein [Pseudonocardiales bacterium]|nr:ABC transporter ATP-binding protein [Pseudonocardiales bacterium]MBV9030030.1 ABC transporter ATP-binding protein [Pseudonocardiales bacterium]MBW0009812.1 ABC transporter ATP-binding protein [Pseudonocardiales bacterium]
MTSDTADPTSATNTVARVLLAALCRHPRALVRLAAWSVLEVAPLLLSGYGVARALDDGFLAGRPGTGLAWLGALAVAVLAGALATRHVYRILAEIVEPFRDDLVDSVVGGALQRSTVLGGRPDSGAVARLTHQVEVVRDNFAGLLLLARSFVVSAAGAVVGMAALTGVVGLLVLPPLLAGLAFFLSSLRSMTTRQRDHVLTDEGVADSAGTVAHSLRDVVACGAEDRAYARVQRQVDAHAEAERTLARMAAVRTLSVAVGGWLPVVGLLVVAPWLLGSGSTLGTIAGALVYLTQGLLPALRALVDGLGSGGLRLVVTLDRLVEAGERPVPSSGTARRSAPHGYDLVLDGVTFSYGRHAEPVVNQVDLVIPEGQHLAMVGPSGAGKSTLAGLLAATHVPDCGEVRLGGVPVGDLDPQTLVGHRVLIPQEAYVFAGTVEENLRYLHPGATRAELDTAVDALGLRSMMTRLGGYDAVVDPGTLSAGERQLIAVARAHLTPAPVLILDEATCHLDPVAEERVERVLTGRGGTLIVVAHRISSALRAQRIVLMNGAEMVWGTHGELLATAPLYRDLVGQWDIGQENIASGRLAGRSWPEGPRGTLTSGTTGRY